MVEIDTLVLGYTFAGPLKADLPEKILENVLSDTNALTSNPVIFKLESNGIKKVVGVREFSAPPSEIGLNEDIAASLHLQVGDPVQLSQVDLPKGTQITLKTSNSDAIDWKSLLESWIPKNCTALSLGDTLKIPYLGSIHDLEVISLAPSSEAVCCVDTDMDLEVETGVKIDEKTVPRFEYDMPLDIGDRIVTLTAPVTSESIIVSCSELAYIGPEHATSPTSFIAVVDSHPTPISTSLIGTNFSITSSGTLTVRQPYPPPSSIATDADTDLTKSSFTETCEYCGKSIPTQSLVLHTTHCSRNSCKCPRCEQKFGNTTEIPNNHLKIHELQQEGSGGQCECNEFNGDTAIELAFHRATSCSLKLHICQFCHLLVPCGATSPVDAAMGLSGHESQCGNRTADCPLCNRPVRLRNLGIHLNEHDAKRRKRQPPKMCANQNCPYPLQQPDQPWQLCGTCFGPLSVPGSNTDVERVLQRMERRYVLQMTRGCGKPWCVNKYCAMNTKRSFAEALQMAKTIISDSSEHWFCVDETQTRKLMFVHINDNVYSRGWRGLAIQKCATESEAEKWLESNANTL